MRPPVSFIGLLAALLCVGCGRKKAGDACAATPQCEDDHVCFTGVCVAEDTRHLVDITLVGTDQDDLACAIEGPVSGLTCTHSYDQRIRSAVAPRDDASLLQPVTTKSGANMLAAGLWSQPAIIAKLAKSKSTSRFTASCQVEVRNSVEKARVRWKRGEDWVPATHLPVVVVTTCKVGN